VLCFSRKWKLW